MASCLWVHLFLHIFQLGNVGNHGDEGDDSGKCNQVTIKTVT
jgi:hypothetical protein